MMFVTRSMAIMRLVMDTITHRIMYQHPILWMIFSNILNIIAKTVEVTMGAIHPRGPGVPVDLPAAIAHRDRKARTNEVIFDISMAANT